jgi:hypothetical protein
MSEAKEGDVISLDPLGVPSSEWTDVEFVFLVDIATEEILQTSTFEATAESRWVCRHSFTERWSLRSRPRSPVTNHCCAWILALNHQA